MRRSFTAVLERNAVFTSDFATEPYESAWASEARWFIRVLEIAPGAALHLTAQVSPDGLFWCDAGETLALKAPGMSSFALRDFGHWLRLNATLTGPSVKLHIYLALKE